MPAASTRRKVAARGRAKVRATDVAAAVAGLRGRVAFNEPLGPYTSFKIGGPADALVEPADVEDVQRLVRQARDKRVPLFVVGGTNLLIRDRGIRGIVVSLGKLRAIKEEPGDRKSTRLNSSHSSVSRMPSSA